MRPLAGTTVVAVEQAVAAPLATRHLADLGARVIKVERPGTGDFARDYDRAVRGVVGSHFVWLNRNKESVTLDVKSPEGAEVLRALVSRADVFLQNLAPGAAARLGFGAAELLERHPRLVVCDMSGYGSTGPYRDRRAYDLLVQCEAGLVAVTGSPEAPAKTGVPAADIAVGMYAYSGVLAALLERGRTGRGSAIEVSMFDAVAEWMGYGVHYTLHTGEVPPRSGLSHPAIAPYDAYPTADGAQVLIGVQNDREWGRLARDVLHRPELVDDPAYATNVARVAHRAQADAAVAAGVAGLTLAEAVGALDAAGVACARLNGVPELLVHPQLAERDRWIDVGSPAGLVPTLRPVVTVPGDSPRAEPVPDLGEHTDAVLRELGYDDAQIADLHAAEVV